jgi:hypothetical protein
LTSESSQFQAGTLQHAFQVAHELLVDGVVGRLERLERFLGRGDQDPEQRDFLPLRSYARTVSPLRGEGNRSRSGERPRVA